MSAAPAPRGSRLASTRAVALGLLLLVLLAYGPALDAGFVWDDDANVTENLALRSARGLGNLWVTPGTTTQYYPIVYSTFWVEYQLFGLDPLVYHAVNILLHALSTLILWRLLVLLGVPAAGLAAALFAVHPVQVETVAWVTERKNLLSSFFYLGSAYVYFRHVSDVVARPERPRRGYAGMFALYGAALLSKITTVTLGPALLVVTWWKRGRLPLRDALRVAPMIAVGVPLGLLTRSMESGLGDTLGFEWDPSPIERLLQASRALFFYLGTLAWPVDLAFVYPRWNIDPGSAAAWAPLIGALALPVALFALRDRIGRGPLAAFLYFAGTLAPVLGVLEVYYFRFSFVADHWQYLACIGPLSLAAAVAGRFAERCEARTRTALWIAAGVWVVGLALMSNGLTRRFESSLTLWEDAVDRNPSSYLARYNLGLELQQRDRFADAIEQYRVAQRLRPDSAAVRVNMGLIEAHRGRPDVAIALYEEGLALEPDNPRLLWNLGIALEARGETERAFAYLEQSLASPDPRPGEQRRRAAAHAHFAALLEHHGQPLRAIDQYTRSLAVTPQQPAVRLALARLLVDAGRVDAARRELEALLRDRPDSPAARQLLRRLGGAG